MQCEHGEKGGIGCGIQVCGQVYLLHLISVAPSCSVTRPSFTLIIICKSLETTTAIQRHLRSGVR